MAAKIQLRDYQAAAVDELLALPSGRRDVLYMPTGAGKTEAALSLADREMAAGRRVGFLVDRLPLLAQSERRAQAAGLPAGVLHEDYPLPPADSMFVASMIQTCRSRGLSALPFTPDVLIVDECHTGDTWVHQTTAACAAAGARVVGLTATPWNLGQLATWDGIVSPVTHDELVARGLLIEPRTEDRAERIGFDDSSMAGVPKKGGGGAGEWRDGATAEVMDVFTARIAADVRRVLTSSFCADGEVPRVIAFGATKDHARGLASAIGAALGIGAGVVLSGQAKREREAVIEAFAAGDVRVLSSVAALTTGFDEPRAVVLVVARPLCRSLAMWIQMRGRICRTAPGKREALVLDYVRNHARFARATKRVCAAGAPALPRYVRRPARQDSWTCRNCEAANRLTDGQCVRCGELRPAREGVVRECEACGHVQAASVMRCGGCGVLFPARPVPVCGIDGSPLTRTTVEDEEEGARGVWRCLMPGCGFSVDADMKGRVEAEEAARRRREEEAERRRRAAEEERRRDEASLRGARGAGWAAAFRRDVERLPEPGRTVVLMQADELVRRGDAARARKWGLAQYRNLKKAWPPPAVSKAADRLTTAVAAGALAGLPRNPAISAAVRLQLRAYARRMARAG